MSSFAVVLDVASKVPLRNENEKRNFIRLNRPLNRTRRKQKPETRRKHNSQGYTTKRQLMMHRPKLRLIIFVVLLSTVTGRQQSFRPTVQVRGGSSFRTPPKPQAWRQSSTTKAQSVATSTSDAEDVSTKELIDAFLVCRPISWKIHTKIVPAQHLFHSQDKRFQNNIHL